MLILVVALGVIALTALALAWHFAAERDRLQNLLAREVGEPTARRMPSRLENGAAAGGPPGGGGNPGARLSARTDDAPPGAARVTARHDPTARPRLTETAIPAAVTASQPPSWWGPATEPSVKLTDAALAQMEAERRIQVELDKYGDDITPAGMQQVMAAIRQPAVLGAPGGCTGGTYPFPRLELTA